MGKDSNETQLYKVHMKLSVVLYPVYALLISFYVFFLLETYYKHLIF